MESPSVNIQTVYVNFPPDHIFFSLIATIFFMPLGIAALLEGVKVRKAIKMKNFDIAERASINAAKLSMAGVMAGAFIGAVVACVVLVTINQKP